MVDENTVGLWVTNDKIPAGHQTQYLVIPWPFHKPRYLPTCLSEPIINFWYCLFSVLWYFCSLLLKALSECWSSAVCVCVCIYAWLPCGDSVQADLFICSLICQTRSNTSVPLYQNFFSFIQTEISAQTDTQVHTRSLLSTDHLQSCQCPPAGQSPARPPYKINEFHGTAAATSNNHALGLYSPKQINLNHLFEKHAQHDTEIHANLWQTISKFPFQI